MSPILPLGVRRLPVDLIKAWDRVVCWIGTRRTDSLHTPCISLHQLVVLGSTHRTFDRLLHKIVKIS